MLSYTSNCNETDSVKEFVKAHRSRKQKPALAEVGKPRTTGKKPKRKGILKRSGAQIRKIIAIAETSGMEWQVRGCHETQLESEHMNELSDFESSSSCQPVTTPSSAESMAPDESFGQNLSVTRTAGTFVVTQSDVHNINFGSICGTTLAQEVVQSSTRIFNISLYCY